MQGREPTEVMIFWSTSGAEQTALSASRAGSGPVLSHHLYHTHIHIIHHASNSHTTLSWRGFVIIKTRSQKDEEPSKAKRGSTPGRIENQVRAQANTASPRQGASSPATSVEHFTHLQRGQGDLRADVRVEAERKLKALEADLVAGERANKERALATRYHKIKFFGALRRIVLHIISLTRTIRSSEAPA
jgi:hypothetical protein